MKIILALALMVFQLPINANSQTPMLNIPEINIYGPREIEIPLLASDNLTIYGLAGTIVFNPEHILFEAIESDYLPGMGIENINLKKVGEGHLSFIYLNPQANNILIPNGSAIIKLKFTPISSSCLDSSMILMSNEDVPWELVWLDQNKVESSKPILDTALLRIACPMYFAKIETILPICLGDSNGSIKTVIQGGFPPYSFRWSNGDIYPEITGLPSGNYQITVTDFYANEIFEKIELMAPVSLAVNVDVRNSTCGLPNGETYLSPEQNDGIGIHWSDDKREQIWQRSSLTMGVYHFTLSNNSGCHKDTFAVIEDESLETPDLPDSIWICPGGNLEVNPINSKILVSWLKDSMTLAAGTNSFQPETPGIYEVRYSLAENCYQSKTISVSIEEDQPFGFEDTSVVKGSMIVFRSDSSKSVTWSSNEFNIPCNDCHQIDLQIESRGFLTAEIRSENGCLSKHVIFIDLINRPFELFNVITPNKDGINDQWKVDLDGLEVTQLQLFNSYGSKLNDYESLEDLNDWIETKTPNPGVYYFKLSIRDDQGRSKDYYGDLNIVY